MTAYEFTRFEPTFTYADRARVYDANMLASLLVQRNPSKDLRTQREYREAEDIYYELTMSCDRGEALAWLRYWMANAIAYGLTTKDTKWGYFFLAAYDIQSRLARR